MCNLAMFFVEPFYTADDLKKKYNKQKAQKVMLKYGEVNTQQKEIISEVQIIIVVANDNEFMATMCYLTPPDHQNAVLKVLCKALIGSDINSQIFFIGNFGKCPAAVAWLNQGCGEKMCYVSLQREYFKNLVLIAAVGAIAGFPDGDVKLGDVLISEEIHVIHEQQDETCNPWSSSISTSKFILNLLKEHFDWKFPCTTNESRDASIKFGLILNKPVLLSDVTDRTQSLQYFGQKPKGIEVGSFDMTGSLKCFIIIKGVCNFIGDNTKLWEPTAALAANDYLYHHLYQTDLSLLVEGMYILHS